MVLLWGEEDPFVGLLEKALDPHKSTQKQTSEMEVLQFLGHHTSSVSLSDPSEFSLKQSLSGGTGIKCCTTEGGPYPSPPAELPLQEGCSPHS